MSVTPISISLSWSVSSGSVLSSEVVWRDADEETNSSSGSLLGTTYTIDLLRSFTLYNITVAVTYSAGYTDTSHLSVSTEGIRLITLSINVIYGLCYFSFRFCSCM